MIIVKAPCRIPLAGGGTDLPAFYEKRGGFWITAAIDKYCYVAAKPRFEKQILLHYREVEEVNRLPLIKHRIFREALKWFDIQGHIELSSLSDLPSRSGMGGSGAFTVALTHALSIYARRAVENLAEEAISIETDAGGVTGKQDQYAAMLGGVRRYIVNTRGIVTSEALKVNDLQGHLLLFYTGVMRDAADSLVKVGRSQELENTLEIAYHSYAALGRGDYHAYGELLNEHWAAKKQMLGDDFDKVHRLGLRSGAVGGKLIGAGGGGFFMFYVDDLEARGRLVKAMEGRGYPLQPFRFADTGSRVVEV